MTKKQYILPIAAAGLLLVAGIGATVAYFSSREDIKNEITVGDNKISIMEDFELPTALVKGLNTYKKSIKVENTGTTDAFVRVYVDFSDSEVAKTSFIARNNPNKVTVSDSDIFTDIKDKLEAAGYTEYKKLYTEGTVVNGWEYISSETDGTLGGYFYYDKAVAPGEETEVLINSIATYFETEEDIQDYDIIVYAESIQTIANDGVTDFGSDYKLAWTKFLERK